jgi:molecular chaperone GrpE
MNQPHDMSSPGDRPEPHELEDSLPAPDGDSPLERGPSDEELIASDDSGDESQELHELRERAAEATQIEGRLKRAEAEFVNEAKRLKRNAANDRKYAIEKVVVDLIPIADALHSARAGLGESEGEQRMGEGLDLITRQLMEALGRHGVEAIDAEGAFDPNRHEALFTVPRDDLPTQTIVEVIRPGFALHGRVVRPAEVAVSSAPQSSQG